MATNSWKQFELPSTSNGSANGGIAAVSRIPNSMEIWWIGANGSVQDAFWYEGQEHWGQFEIAPPGSASPNGGITAVSRIPNSMEIWWVGANGSVQDAFWYEGQERWGRLEIAPPGRASPNGGITAVSRIPNSMEVWWIGANGSVQDAFWYEQLADPVLDVRTERHQLGGWIHVSGEGFTPSNRVQLFVDGLVRRTDPFTIGSTDTLPDG